MQLIGRSSNGVGKQQNITLQPSYLDWGILKTDSWTAHFEVQEDMNRFVYKV